VIDWVAAELLGAYAVLTVLTPLLLRRPHLLFLRPRVVMWAWMTSLATALMCLTLALGILIGRALTRNITPVPSHSEVSPLLDVIGGWLSIAVLGILLFRLGAAGAELRAETKERVQRLTPLLGSATAIEVDRRRVLVVPSDLRVVGAVPALGSVLITTGVMDALTEDQLRAALAHEFAHIRGNHTLVRAIGSLAVATAPGFSASENMAQAARITTELIADDVASAKWGDRTVAQALLAAYPGDALIAERVARLNSRGRAPARHQ
jgi:Zn-dependent protease with chaperone function